MLPLTQMVPKRATGKYEKRQGIPAARIFNLPENWPRG